MGAVANALHALTLLVARQLWSEPEGLDGSIDFFVLPPLRPLVGSSHDFSQTSDLIERAVRSEAWIAAGGLDRPGVLVQLGAHTQAS